MAEWKKLNRFLQLCLDIAERYDNKGDENHNWFGDDLTKDLGLGYRAMTGYLRNGVAEVIKLQGEIHSTRERIYFSKLDTDNMRSFLIDIFGDEEPESLNDEIKVKIRKAVHEILEAEDGKNEE